jgi:hypothetical protein
MKFSNPRTTTVTGLVGANITDPDDSDAQAAVLDEEPDSDGFGLVTRPVQSQRDANTTHELLYLMLEQLQILNKCNQE